VTKNQKTVIKNSKDKINKNGKSTSPSNKKRTKNDVDDLNFAPENEFIPQDPYENEMEEAVCKLCGKPDQFQGCGPLTGPFLVKKSRIFLHEKCIRFSSGFPPYEYPFNSKR